MKTPGFVSYLPLLVLIACSGPDRAGSPTAKAVVGEIQPAAGQGELATYQLLRQILRNNPQAVSVANRQIILVSNSSPEELAVVIRTFEYEDGTWQMKFPGMGASGGRNGFAPLGEKVEGDGRAPSGLFEISGTFGYHESAETRMPYRQATNSDFWIDDVASENYNQWVRLARGKRPGVSHEQMKRDDYLYEYGIIIDYNVDPIVKNKGSAIFMHVERAPGAPTAGCIATAAGNVLTLFKWLDPDKAPIIIMGTESELAKARFTQPG